jgi:hypothetical protein
MVVIVMKRARVNLLIVAASIVLACSVAFLAPASVSSRHSISNGSNASFSLVNYIPIHSNDTLSNTDIQPLAINSPVTLSQLSASPATGGDTSTQFTFTVQYINANNYPPSYGIILVIDNKAYSMTKQNTNDVYYMDGCAYIYQTSLESGSHSYYVYCVDDLHQTIRTDSSTIVVQAATILSNPGPTVAIVLISVGVFLTILVPALAHNIRMKKLGNVMSPIPSHAPSSGGNPVPFQGSLPATAFVQQPLPVPTTMPFEHPRPAVLSTTLRSNLPSEETILPGTPKWARLARFDISQYMWKEPPQDDVVEDSTEDELIQDGIRFSRSPASGNIGPEPVPSIIDFPSPPTTDPSRMNTAVEDHESLDVPAESLVSHPDTKTVPHEEKCFRITRDELCKDAIHAKDVPMMLHCPACGARVESSGVNDDLVYFCKACQKPMVLEITCPKCYGKIVMPQDEDLSSFSRSPKCMVCFEALLPDWKEMRP